MRERRRILHNLEGLYREDFEAARAADDRDRMRRLDFEFQRDQLYMEVLLDLRDLLSAPTGDVAEEGVSSLLDKAQKLRNLTRLR
jgi:hypothetical protein